MDQHVARPAAGGPRRGRAGRRGTALVAASASLVLVAGVGVAAVRLADRPQAYSEDAAVAAFRAAQEPSGPDASTPGTSTPGAGEGSEAARPAPASAAPSASARGATGSAARPPRPAGAAGAGKAATAKVTSGAPGKRPAAPAPARTADGPAAPSAGDGQRGVAPGVYRYATTGFEEVDALGGSRHDYPATTSVTYTSTGCGTDERWQPARERSTVARRCLTADGLQIRSLLQQREFYGQKARQDLDCGPGVMLLPASPKPGQRWQGQCSSPDTRATVNGTVVAVESVDVQERGVPAVRVLLSTTLTGATRGRSDREVWLRQADGLLLKARGNTDTTADSVGGPVRYREQYDLALLSDRPRR